MTEALYYDRLAGGRVRCRLCPRSCEIRTGRSGVCGARRNIGGTLYAASYGIVASIAVDPIEKKPLYHFCPGARTLSIGGFGCNLRCKHCQNWELSRRPLPEQSDPARRLAPRHLVEEARRRNCPVVAWTYNEPSIWFEYLLDGARAAHDAGLLTVLVTSGMINPAPLQELLPLIDAYRLDIKGFTEEFYERLTGSRVLATVLDNACRARSAGVHLEIVTNLIPNWNDSDAELDGLSRWIVEHLGRDTPWHLTAYHPAFRVAEPPTPVSTLERGRRIGRGNGLHHVFVGNVAGHPAQNTDCPHCGSLLIAREGFGPPASRLVEGRCPDCAAPLVGFRGPRRRV